MCGFTFSKQPQRKLLKSYLFIPLWYYNFAMLQVGSFILSLILIINTMLSFIHQIYISNQDRQPLFGYGMTPTPYTKEIYLIKIGQRTHKYDNRSKFRNQDNPRGLYNHLMSMRTFTLISNKVFI